MSDHEVKPETTEQPEQQPQENVRNTPAFQAVTRQLNEERTRIADMQSEIAKFKEAEDARSVKRQEEAGEYEKVKETLQAKNEALQSQIEQMQSQHETANVKADLKAALVAEGATNPKALDFLCNDFLGLEDKPDVAEWAKGVAASDEYSVFFVGAPTATNPAPQSSVAGTPGKTNWSQVREDMNAKGNPGKVQKAARLAEAYLKQHGKMPW